MRALYAHCVNSTGRPGIDAHLRELDLDGLTIVPPSLVHLIAPECAGLPERLREALVRLASEGKAIERRSEGGLLVVEIHDLLEQDPVFKEAAEHPAVLALVESWLGEGFRLRSCAPLVVPAEQRTDGMRLHCDGGDAHLSCVWVLTQYNWESGALRYVPGSHRLARMPEGDEGTDEATAVEAPPGSLLVFDGHLWHGTWPRPTPGDRLGVHCLFMGTSQRH